MTYVVLSQFFKLLFHFMVHAEDQLYLPVGTRKIIKTQLRIY